MATPKWGCTAVTIQCQANHLSTKCSFFSLFLASCKRLPIWLCVSGGRGTGAALICVMGVFVVCSCSLFGPSGPSCAWSQINHFHFTMTYFWAPQPYEMMDLAGLTSWSPWTDGSGWKAGANLSLVGNHSSRVVLTISNSYWVHFS